MRTVDAPTASDETTGANARFVAPELVALDASGTPHLIGGRCKTCQAESFPRASLCTECLCEEVEAVELPHEGTLYSYSVVHQAPKGWKVPYVLGYVDLADNVRVLAHIDAPAKAIAIDMPLKLGIGVVGSDPAGAELLSYTFIPV